MFKQSMEDLITVMKQNKVVSIRQCKSQSPMTDTWREKEERSL